MRITMVGTCYVGRIRNDPCFPAGSTLSYCLLTKILFGLVLPNFRYCLYRGRTSFSTVFFLSFESETAGVRCVAGGLLLDQVALGSYIRSMRMATRFRTSAVGRAKQEQFGAMQRKIKLHAE